jgi:CspA family cold shock protein
MSSEEFVTGLVKWFDPAKGWGFITLPGGGVDVFVHINQLRKAGIDSVVEGDRVKFETSKGTKGAFATNITLLKE